MNNLVLVSRSLLLLFAAWIIGMPSFAQHTIRGVIKDSATGNPVVSASIFISRTQLGVVSKADGSFTLRLPGTDCDLVVSCVGFETQVLHLPASRKDSDITIWMIAKSAMLDNVTVTAKPVDRSDWLRYNAIFTKAFLGESDFAANCMIENANVLHYRYDSGTNTLTAYAGKPIVITNKSLGYSIQYLLADFSYNGDSRELVYGGYPLFTPLTGNVRQMAKWNANRKEAYNGSLLQFMRSVFRNRVLEDGFEVQAIVKVPANIPEKDIRWKKRPKRAAVTAPVISGMPGEDTFEVVSDEPLPADSFAYAADSVTAAMALANKYMVTYKKGRADAWYTTTGNGITIRQRMISYMNLRDSNEPVFVESNGSFFPLHRLIIEGYWSWSERIGRLLPYDYTAGP